MDIQILTWINDNLHGIPFFNYLFKFITLLGELGFIWVATGVIMFFFKKTRKCSIYIFVALFGSLVINDLILKHIISRPRPFTVNTDLAVFIESIGLDLPTSFSFPSGHSFSSFACATMIFITLRKKWCFVYILAFLIALSRVFIGVHYLTDILAGMILGTLTAIGLYYLCEFILKKFNNRKQKPTE